MAILDSLFTSATAFVNGDFKSARTSLFRAIGEAKKSEVGKKIFAALDEFEDRAKEVAAQIGSTARASWDTAQDVLRGAYEGARTAWEEKREYEAKRQRDGRLNEEDTLRDAELAERLRKIQRDITELKTGMAAFNLGQGEIFVAEISGDELSANTGLFTTKVCPSCGGTMTIRQGAFNTNKKQHSFYWDCISNLKGYRCRTISINVADQGLDVIRSRNVDLDGDANARRIAWTQRGVIARTHQRFRALVGELDEDLLCPIHVAPLRIQQRAGAGGRLLDSYEHACIAVLANGASCNYSIPISAFPQVASVLRRKTNRGILDGGFQY